MFLVICTIYEFDTLNDYIHDTVHTFELNWTNFICRQAHNIYAYKISLFFLFYIQYSKKIYFKKRTRPLLHQQLTGGFAKIFFFSAEPPPSRDRTVHIALFLNNNHSYI